MKKAGIVSFVSSENYGAILQSVALQCKLRELGINGIHINYAPTIPIKGFKKKCLNKVYSFIRIFLGFQKRMKRTNEFKNKFLQRTPIIHKLKEAERIASEFEIFIVGSDQVWNPLYLAGSKDFYFLTFAGEKAKYSYASSFGIDHISETYKSIFKSYLSKFLAISVRERTGNKILQDLGINCQTVVDPTLLLTKNEWVPFLNKKARVISKYIFCYVMTGDHKSARFIYEYAKKLKKYLGTDHEIIIVGDKEYKKFKHGYNLICDAGPAEFLEFVNNASYIITNSYHGTCFSINFNKPFSVVLDVNNRVNSRIIDLLSDLSIPGVIYYTNTDLVNCNISSIDYSLVNEKLSMLRENSCAFIREYIL